MTETLGGELKELGVDAGPIAAGEETAATWRRLRDFPAAAGSPLVLKADLTASRVIGFVRLVQAIDPQASIQAHAGSGVVLVRFSQFPADRLTGDLVGRMQPAAAASNGTLVVLSYPEGGLTPKSFLGGVQLPLAAMKSVKQQFDPLGILNPGRFLV
ncbi:MAG: hypothetical protein IID41_18145 [Planctomycetes bacterium]|nr:hypothetical protein [Planctomycetota bacterium]